MSGLAAEAQVHWDRAQKALRDGDFALSAKSRRSANCCERDAGRNSLTRMAQEERQTGDAVKSGCSREAGAPAVQGLL
jgi:hypothetical protein